MIKSIHLLVPVLFSSLFACNSNRKNATEKENHEMNITEETVTYKTDSVSMNGFIAWDKSINTKRPVVLIVHEWWGLNEYPKMRARQLASLGYFAMAVDLYGNGNTANTPDEANALAGQFYSNPQLAKQRFDAALEKVKSMPEADTDRIAAIGYCFGGGMLLNIARLGEDLRGVVSFHGMLNGVPADKNLLKASILVCHGDSDKFVSQDEVMQFSHEMDSIGADYKVIHYANATHAFTNPSATETGMKFSMPVAYHAEADTASFRDMQDFLKRIFE